MYALMKRLFLSVCSFSFAFICFLVAVFILMRKGKRRDAIIACIIGLVFLYAVSTPFLPNAILGTLESRYPVFVEENGWLEHIKYVVVLSGGHVYNEHLPLTSQFNKSGLARVVEGVRLVRKMPDAELVLSGGPSTTNVTDASLMFDLCVDLGIEKNRIIPESVSRNTFDQARYVKDIVGNEPFVLVTSAYHMPRAMALFDKQGLSPMPAPTDHRVKSHTFKVTWLLPNVQNCKSLELALYEYVGLLKAWMLERIN